MNEQSKGMKVAALHTGDEAEIIFRKAAGDEKWYCEITANSAASALNAVCIIVQEYAKAIQLPATHVVAVVAATMAEPKESEAAK